MSYLRSLFLVFLLGLLAVGCREEIVDLAPDTGEPTEQEALKAEPESVEPEAEAPEPTDYDSVRDAAQAPSIANRPPVFERKRIAIAETHRLKNEKKARDAEAARLAKIEADKKAAEVTAKKQAEREAKAEAKRLAKIEVDKKEAEVAAKKKAEKEAKAEAKRLAKLKAEQLRELAAQKVADELAAKKEAEQEAQAEEARLAKLEAEEAKKEVVSPDESKEKALVVSDAVAPKISKTVTAVSLKQLQIEYLAPAPKAVENPEAKDGAAEQSEENIYAKSKSSPGNVQLYMAAESAKNRKTKAEVANKTFEIYQKTADSVWSAEDKEEKAKLCTELKSLLDRAFPEAEHAMLDALSDEEKQLKMIRKAYLIAERRGGKLPEGDMDAIIRRRAELASGHPYSQVKEEIAACRKTVEGMVSFLEGDVDAAVSAMAEAELLSPDSLYALIYRGILHQKQGDYKISRTCWSKALAVDPKNKSLRTALKSLPE